MALTTIFTAAGLFAYLDRRIAAATNKAASIPAAALAGGGGPAVLEALMHDFELQPVTLTDSAFSTAMEDVQVDISQDFRRVISDRTKPRYIPGTRTIFYLPFTGEQELLTYTPGTFTPSPPVAELAGTEIRLLYDTTNSSELAAVKGRFDTDLSVLRQWLSWSGTDVAQHNQRLRASLSGAIAQRERTLSERELHLSSMGMAVRSKKSVGVSASIGEVPGKTGRYDVALSFAGEERSYVKAVAECLHVLGYSVFFDEFETIALWGSNLIDHLADVYQNRSDYVIMFCSAAYAAKAWPTHERQNAQARALISKGEYILPVRFDETDIPGLPHTVSYLDARSIAPVDLGSLAAKKIGSPKYSGV